MCCICESSRNSIGTFKELLSLSSRNSRRSSHLLFHFRNVRSFFPSSYPKPQSSGVTIIHRVIKFSEHWWILLIKRFVNFRLVHKSVTTNTCLTSQDVNVCLYVCYLSICMSFCMFSLLSYSPSTVGYFCFAAPALFIYVCLFFAKYTKCKIFWKYLEFLK